MHAHGGSNPHRIGRHGPNKMVLSCSRTGTAIIEASRPEGAKSWTLMAHGSESANRTVETDDTRRPVVFAMIGFAEEELPHEGFEVNIPPRRATPDEVATSPFVFYREVAGPDGNPQTVPMIHLWDEP